MTLPEHYQGDVLAFFSGHPEELDLYLAFLKVWTRPSLMPL